MHKIAALIYFKLIISTSAFNFNCELPIGCEANEIHYEINYYEKTSIPIQGILCKVQDENFHFKYSKPSPLISKCQIHEREEKQTIEIRFHRELILGKWFNITNMLNYGKYFHANINLNFVKLKGFELDIINTKKQSLGYLTTNYHYYFSCLKCRIEFYSNNRLIKTCQDIIDFNPNKDLIRSLFQFSNSLNGIILTLFDPQFKTTICPLMFKYSHFFIINMIGLIDTFYKRSVLTIENQIFDDLESTIWFLQMHAENINIDSSLLNPSVFQKTIEIKFNGKFNTIDGRSLGALKSLNRIIFSKEHFRDTIHKNGIKWINSFNANLSVNLSSLSELQSYYGYRKKILIYCTSYNPEIRLSKVFPDVDFCLYKDYPFKQLVILTEYAEREEVLKLLISRDYTCTYLWLAQYFDKFLYLSVSNINYELVVNSTSYKSISKCDFQYRLSLCDKSTYEQQNWWGTFDYFILSKKLQTVFKIGQYLVALFGIATNLLVVIIILHKKNKETFKDLNHYSYLWLNSVFNLLILIITLLSWTSECFYPFEVFCPETRKAIFTQYFKILFKEVIVTLLKFMCNFTYVAFALNRIALIGKDHSKIVKFVSNLDIKVYTLVTFLISCSLSWIKFFKYQVNNFEPNVNYPISNDWDLMKMADYTYDKTFLNMFLIKHIPYKLYFVYNSVSDVINYVIFVIVIIIIDTFMVAKLKRTLEDKLKWYDKETNSQKYEAKKKENEDAVSQIIKMVLINTAIGVLFKFPSSFISIVNLYAAFYYQNYENIFKATGFGEFNLFLMKSGFSILIIDIYEFLFIVSISVQFFIYKRFDKKFLQGYNNIPLFKKKNKTLNYNISTISKVTVRSFLNIYR